MQNKNNSLVFEYVLYRLFKINIDNVKKIKMASRSQNTFDRNFGVTTSFEISVRRDCSIHTGFQYKCSVQVSQSWVTLCDPIDYSMPGFPVHHQLLELAQTCVHRVGDAIQPSHPLSSHSPRAFNLSQQQGLFQQASSLHQVAKQWLFQIDFL